MVEESFINKRIANYRILAELGRGGMGIVYKALDEKKDELVAIKVLPPDFLTDRRKAQYLDHEFKIALELDHPNIIRFYKMLKIQTKETKGKRGFLVMELIDGWNMRKHIQEQDLNVFQAVDLFFEVCTGLDYIHQHGIVHGDMKPENILISPSGLSHAGVIQLAKSPFSDTWYAPRTLMSTWCPRSMSKDWAWSKKDIPGSLVMKLPVALTRSISHCASSARVSGRP